MNPSVSAPARARILDAALRLYALYPVQQVGVETILAQAGAAKATLYKIFGSKEELTAAAMRAAGETMVAEARAALGAGEPAGQALADLLRRWLGDGGFSGCLYLRLAAQVDLRASPFAELDRKHAAAIFERLAAGRDKVAAEAMSLVLEGALRRLERTPEEAPAILAAARSLFDRAQAPGSGTGGG